MNNIKFSCSIW